VGGDALRVGSLDEAALRDDGGNVLVGGDVEGEVEHIGRRRRRGMPERRGHLVAPSLFDRDVLTVGEVAVERAEGRRHVEGHPVGLRGDRQAVRADLVGHVSVCRNTVRTDDDTPEGARPENIGGGAVAQHRHLDPRLLKFPGRQARPLKERARFIGEDAEPFSLLVGGVEDRQRRPAAGGGQGAGVAVGQPSIAVADEGRAVAADSPAGFPVLISDAAGLLEQPLLDHFDGLCGGGPGHLFHPPQGPEEVYRRGPSGGQTLGRLFQVAQERGMGRRL